MPGRRLRPNEAHRHVHHRIAARRSAEDEDALAPGASVRACRECLQRRYDALSWQGPEGAEFCGLGGRRRQGGVGVGAIAVTTPGHIAGRDLFGTDGFADVGKKGDFEVRPNGNAVNLETEMVKSSENQIDYQAVSSLYQKNLDLLKEAIGKK